MSATISKRYTAHNILDFKELIAAIDLTKIDAVVSICPHAMTVNITAQENSTLFAEIDKLITKSDLYVTSDSPAPVGYAYIARMFDDPEASNDDILETIRKLLEEDSMLVAELEAKEDMYLEKIASLTKRNEELTADRTSYRAQYIEHCQKIRNIKKQLSALSVLTSAIGN